MNATTDTVTVETRPKGLLVTVKQDALQELPRGIWARGRSGTQKALSRTFLSAGDLILVAKPSGQPVLHQVIGRPEQEYDHITRSVGVFANVRKPSLKALAAKLPKDSWWTEEPGQSPGAEE